MNQRHAAQRPFACFAAVSAATVALLGSAALHASAPLTFEVPALVAQGGATYLKTLPASQKMQLAISLPIRNESALNALLSDLYRPGSPDYRHYLNTAEFTERFAPSAADYAAVEAFVAASGLTVTHSATNRLVLDVEGSVAAIDKALHVHMGVYQHPSESRSFYAPDREPDLNLGVPVLGISGLDDFVLPTAHLIPGKARSATSATGTGSGPDGSFLGSDIRAAYYGGGTLTGAGQSIGVLELGPYNPADVEKYFIKVKQPLKVPVIGVSVNSASATCSSVCADAEQALDIEEAISMAPGLSKLVVYVGTSPASILNRMASDNTSKQLSCSWGWQDNESILDPILKEFEAQGQSFLVATGDDGYELKEGVVWPADDQNATAVGGTDLVTAGPGGPWQSETGWSYSGGGPSPDGVPIPSYQVPFINASNQGSTTLRNVPDIAGAAENFYSCYAYVCTTGNGGTSYAAPLWAGFIALANEQLAGQGLPSLGFLNNTIYATGGSASYASDFHDEVSGYNGLYNAVPGYDLVTGFGSPQGETLIDALISGG